MWTTGSWLVHTYLERADAAGRAAAEAAIEAGDLAWHALPFTTHTELCDVALVEAGLEIAARLDHRFGRRTIAAKMTDVPGHTRGLVPLLAAAGVELLHIGVNPVATVPDVPACFRWRQPDGAEVVVAYQAGGYGDLTEVPGCPDRAGLRPHRRQPRARRPPTRWWPPSPRCGRGCPAPRCGPRPSTPSPRPCAPVPRRPAGGHRRDRRHVDPRRRLGPAEGRRLPRAAAGPPVVARGRPWSPPTTPGCGGSTSTPAGRRAHLGPRREDPPARPGALVAGRPARAAGRARHPGYEASWAEQRAYVDAAVGRDRQRGPPARRRPRPSRCCAHPSRRGASAPEVPAAACSASGVGTCGVDPSPGASPTSSTGCRAGAWPTPSTRSAGWPTRRSRRRTTPAGGTATCTAPPEEEWWAREDNLKPGHRCRRRHLRLVGAESAAVHLGERWSARRGADGPPPARVASTRAAPPRRRRRR